MISPDIENVNVTSFAPMPSPEALHSKLPLTDLASETVMQGREALRNIIDRKDKRLFVVVGPCSIHDPVAGLDYARRLKALQAEVADTMLLVMRVYFEKPRTTTGWKGYINDPDMDDSFRVNVGMEKARQFLLDVCELGLPTATEALDPISPQYLGDLIAWTAIGAAPPNRRPTAKCRPACRPRSASRTAPMATSALRSTPSCRRRTRTPSSASTRRAMCRSCAPWQRLRPRGAARRRRPSELRFGVDRDCRTGAGQGQAAGQPGGRLLARQQLQEAGTATAGDGRRHPPDRQGNKSLVGVMIESNIVGGNQKIPADLSQLVYGCSVTDGCIDWDTTEKCCATRTSS
jgi:3-deoxy-7-phosphoheptulonate synthase